VRRTRSKLGKDTFVILVSKFLYPYSHLPCFLWFLHLADLFIFVFFVKLVTLFSYICYICVYIYQHRFNFQTDSTAQFFSMALCWNYFFAEPSLAVIILHNYCTRLAVWISVYKFFSQLALLLGGSTHLCFKFLIGTKSSL